jgi:hypothetical protein
MATSLIITFYSSLELTCQVFSVFCAYAILLVTASNGRAHLPLGLPTVAGLTNRLAPFLTSSLSWPAQSTWAWTAQKTLFLYCSVIVAFENTILYAICRSTFIELFKNLYNGMLMTVQ